MHCVLHTRQLLFPRVLLEANRESQGRRNDEKMNNRRAISSGRFSSFLSLNQLDVIVSSFRLRAKGRASFVATAFIDVGFGGTSFVPLRLTTSKVRLPKRVSAS